MRVVSILSVAHPVSASAANPVNSNLPICRGVYRRFIIVALVLLLLFVVCVLVLCLLVCIFLLCVFRLGCLVRIFLL